MTFVVSQQIFVSQLQPLPAVVKSSLSSLLGKQLFGFLPKKFGFWVVLHLWNHQRLDNTYLSISLLLLETLVIQAVWLLSPLPLVPV